MYDERIWPHAGRTGSLQAEIATLMQMLQGQRDVSG
jgi:hypothetical protein